MIFARERDSARGAEGECCWTSPSVTFSKGETLWRALTFCFFPVVSLYLCVERFQESQEQNERFRESQENKP
jgi:hypothetical protein